MKRPSTSLFDIGSSVFKIRPDLILVSCLWVLATPSRAILDANNNGISDLYEEDFNNGQALDPDADPDLDGWSNAEEAAAGTDPFDPNPPDGIVHATTVHIPAVYEDTNADGIPDQLVTPEVVNVTWHTFPGKLYTLLGSPDLATGSWLQIDTPRIGDGSVMGNSIVLTQPGGGTAPKMFWRVSITDTDSDGDGLSDSEEAALGTSPALADTDGDGIPDSEEIKNGTNPTAADSDADGLNDGQDAAPSDPVINWRRTAEPKFAVIDLGIEDWEGLVFSDLSDHGTVLFTKTLQTLPDRRILIDTKQQLHDLPALPPDLVSPLGYFGVPTTTLMGDNVLGTRLLPPAPGSNQDCTWDPVTDTYTPHEVLWYIDDVLDDRLGFWVERSFDIQAVDGEPTLVEILLTSHGVLANSNLFDFSHARVELGGNVVSSYGYWRFNPISDTYGSRQELPEECVTNSATLQQVDQSLNNNPNSIRPQYRWNFAASVEGLLVAKNNGAFVKSGLVCEPGEHPVAVTSQGWLASTHKIWVNGKWIALEDLVTGPKPQQATLLGMLDTGLAVARLEFADSSVKIALLAPMEVRSYVSGESTESAGTQHGVNVIVADRNLIQSTTDYTGFHTAAVSELKIAQWSEVFESLGGWHFDHDKFKKDLDVFRIRLPSLPPPAGTAEHRVKIWTEDASGADFDSGAEADLNRGWRGIGNSRDAVLESASAVGLTSFADFHETAAFCLVPDDETDDQFAVEGKQDGALGDRTYRAKLGGKVKIQWLTAPGPAPKPIFEIPVPSRKTVTVQGYILKTAEGEPSIDIAVAELCFQRARKIMSAVGVDLHHTVAVVASNPPGVLFGLAVDEFSLPLEITTTSGIKLQASPEIRALMSKPTSVTDPSCKPPPGVIPVYFASSFSSPNHKGITTVSSEMDPADVAYANAIFLNAEKLSESTLAHELLHVVLDAAHDGNNTLWGHAHNNELPCLWFYKKEDAVIETGILARRRLLDSMRSHLLKSPFCK